MLRSEEVECIDMYCSANGIRNIIERLGESSVLQIIDINSVQEQELKKKQSDFDLLDQKLRYLNNQVEKQEESSLQQPSRKISFLDARLHINDYYEKMLFLKNNYREAVNEEAVLEQDLQMMKVRIDFTQEMTDENTEVISFDFITAISEKDKRLMIKKVLKTRLRGNLYVKTYEIYLKNNEKYHTLYIIYVLGEENTKFAKNIVSTLGGRVLELASNDQEMIDKINKRYKKIKRLRKNIKNQISDLVQKLELEIDDLNYAINKERSISDAVGFLKKESSLDCYTGKGWVLKKNIPELNALKSFDNEKGRFMFTLSKTELQKPTHFNPSKFALCFQNLTNVFGIPKYREINPGIFMIFTFPFLFGAMFGDVLHGIILLVLSLLMILRFDNWNKKCGVFQIILDGRYVVLSCSIAAIWFGFLYGDFGSLPIALFKSQYEAKRTYPFGIDPIWHHADNKMVFINSLKMKLSLIIGFCHMGLGSIISIINNVTMNNKVDLYSTSLPQALTFLLFLGYVVFLCVYKWLVTIDHPSIVNTLINMYTDPFNIKNSMYSGQMYVQIFIFSFILISIPWMIFSKPIYKILKKEVRSDGMLDLWINSGIHTVEFLLGLISNTSSYLRLWAVSLAHVQLTSVLHEFTIGNSNIIVKIITLPIYIGGTFMLLIGLEGLSSCLHALRLNWIEFFSKFYSGGGEEFKPLNFNLKEE